ncbi:tRNA methyltransferase 10 homolog B [Puntigrus tetrazona]|uniref:tRNA methyltransferase 10 homolog B n=1 Tax=Puntigrus tetrazona TaxID=1606681 RepID=UPI001C8A4835|nr:tRNA methyltransferase 10 homolog B [Puntigrus tetrazona]XP_043100918.1 tRNA methyltransferase 10 homolog B [Puntigrus tetrazona]
MYCFRRLAITLGVLFYFAGHYLQQRNVELAFASLDSVSSSSYPRNTHSPHSYSYNVLLYASSPLHTMEEESRSRAEVEVSLDLLELLRIDVEHEPACDREETTCSKNVMRKQRNWERRLEAKRSRRREEKQRKKFNKADKDANEPQLSKRVIKAMTKERLEEARGAGPGLCVDLSMTDRLSAKEVSRLACQIRRLYGCNKKASRPFRVFLTELKEDSLLHGECVRMNDGFRNYLIDVTEESWFHLFPSEDVIYLTPDSNEALESVEEDKVYILGGLVDETIQKKISYTRAKELGVRTARLPIDEYMVKRPNSKNFHSKVLAINQVFEILLTFRDTKDWTKALAAGIPPGKGYMVPSSVDTHRLMSP